MLVIRAVCLLSFAALCSAKPLFAQDPVQESEPNDTPATADTAVLGGKVTGGAGNSQSDTDKGDYWVVFANAGDTIHVDVDGCRRCVYAHIDISLFAADGTTLLARGQWHDGADEALSYVSTAPGPYFVQVTNNRYGPSTYTLSFTPPASCPTDGAEPNDTVVTAASVSPPADVQARWCPRGDVDWYRVEVPAGMVLEFWVSDAIANGYFDHHLKLLDANGDLIGDEVFYGGSYPNRHLLYQPQSSGPLHIVPLARSSSLIDTYRLHIRAHPAPPPELTLARAGRELMRPGEVLTDHERSYLDALGNKNGTFDVGDFRQFVQLHRGVADWW